MLFVYGSIVPRVIDEGMTQNGRPIGRRYAGPEWGEAITEVETRLLAAGYKTSSGFSKALLEEKDG